MTQQPYITRQQKQVFLPLKWSRKASSKNRLKNTMTIYTFNNKITYLVGDSAKSSLAVSHYFEEELKQVHLKQLFLRPKTKRFAILLLCILTKFWVLHVPESWLKWFLMIFRLCTSLHLFFIFFVVFVWSNTN